MHIILYYLSLLVISILHTNRIVIPKDYVDGAPLSLLSSSGKKKIN